MNALSSNRISWFALQVRSRREKSIADLLVGKGYDTFVPLCEAARTQGEGRRKGSLALFSGYVFCRFDLLDRLPVLVTPGVAGVVGSGRTPVPVEDSEILALQQAVAAGVPVESCPYMEIGQRVRIDEGALRGIEGILIATKGNKRVVISVSLLRRSVAIEIDRTEASPVSPSQKFGSRSVADQVRALDALVA